MLVEVLISLLIFSVVMLCAGFTLMKTQHYHEDAAQKIQQYFIDTQSMRDAKK